MIKTPGTLPQLQKEQFCFYLFNTPGYHKSIPLKTVSIFLKWQVKNYYPPCNPFSLGKYLARHYSKNHFLCDKKLFSLDFLIVVSTGALT